MNWQPEYPRLTLNISHSIKNKAIRSPFPHQCIENVYQRILKYFLNFLR